MKHTARRSWRLLFIGLCVTMVGLLLVPIVGLLFASSPARIIAGMGHPLFWPALWLTAQTTTVSVFAIIVLGTPLAWWLARAQRPGVVELIAHLPIVIPPAVIGIALLQVFGRSGLLGPWLASWEIYIPFTTIAVVLAQIVVAAPFYIQSAASAFRRVDPDLLLVARTLGQSPRGAFFRVALPLAAPGLLTGIALSWGRALGEFGATLLFAGNHTGKTQTMPLAIYMALESDVRAALALSLFLAGFGMMLLLGLRQLPSLWRWNRATKSGEKT